MRYQELDKDAEADLCDRYRAGDASAIETLIRAHEPYLKCIARYYARVYSIDMDDMMQECRFGAMRAAQTFDRSRNVRFLTYAQYWARHCAGRAGQDQAGVFRVPVHMQTAKRAHPQHGVSLSRPAYADGPETLADVLPSSGPSAEDEAAHGEDARWLRGVVDRALAPLSEQMQTIARAHLMCEPHERGFMTLKELGDRYGVTRERIRQIEVKIKVKVGAAIDRAREKRQDRCS
jgi:RNA polymerase primary sigma factor